MGMEEWQTYCPRCERVVLGRRETPSHLLHFLITFLTCGLWVVPWIIMSLVASWRPFRCTICGADGTNK